MERCSGRRGRYAALEWYVVPTSWPGTDGLTYGLWSLTASAASPPGRTRRRRNGHVGGHRLDPPKKQPHSLVSLVPQNQSQVPRKRKRDRS